MVLIFDQLCTLLSLNSENMPRTVISKSKSTPTESLEGLSKLMEASNSRRELNIPNYLVRCILIYNSSNEV